MPKKRDIRIVLEDIISKANKTEVNQWALILII